MIRGRAGAGGRRGVALAMAAGTLGVCGWACAQVAGPEAPRIILEPQPVEQGAPIVACFMEGTDPRYMKAVTEFIHLRNQAFFGHDYYLGNRWPGNQGSPRALTWSFVPDGLVISGGGEPSAPSELFFQMDGGFSGQGGRATWINRFQQMFNRYAQLTGNTYTRIRYNNNDWDDGASWGSTGSTNRGDIRIGMHFIDGGFGTLAYNYYPSSGDMVLDSSDVSYFASPSNSNRNLRNVLGHEHGHGLGMAHTCSSDALILMAPAVGSSFDGPRQDDIRGIQRHYGDPFEPNDTAATARAIGALGTGSPITLGTIPAPVAGTNDINAALCSIDADAEVDWYSFTVSAAVAVSAVATPVGSTYDNSQQAANGSCPSGSFINAKNVADLVVAIYDTNGTSVLATASATGLGQAETISNLQLPTAGTYYVRVSENNLPSSTQLYTLTLSSNCATTPAIINQPGPQTVETGATVVFSATATNATGYQWRKDGVDLANGGRISGAATPILTITGAVLADSGIYTMRAIGACATATTNGASLTVVCYPNCDASTGAPLLTVADFVCFQNRFVAGDTSANCDGSSVVPVLNIYDFICFMTKFSSGCQ